MNEPVETSASRTLDQGFQLDGLRIEPKSCEAIGPGGRERLDPKVMDVLVMLAQHAGQVVLRENLLARLWPNVVVTDEVLSRCIYELRRQLSLAGGSERYKEIIETLPKRGYRLIGEVTPIHSQQVAPPVVRSKRKLLALIVAGGAAVALALVLLQRAVGPPAESQTSTAGTKTNSIAVLPFVDMSPGKDQGYLADGISEEILNRLAKAENLRVIARTSSFALRDPSLDVGEIAKRLNVSHVLEGSVRKSGEHIRITAQLISASNSSHVWSETYERGLDDVFAVQDEIATAVTSALAIKFAGEPSNSSPPSNFEAHEKFLQGEFFFYRRAPGDFERSIKYYETAVALDPRYARAWASLATAYSMLARESHPPIKSLQLKEGLAARKAVELEPDLAVAHIRLAQYYAEIEEPDKAEDHFRRAMELDPDDGYFLAREIERAVDRGDLAAAIAIQRRLVARDPLAAVVRNDLAVYLLADGRLDEALTEFRNVQAISPDTDPNVAIDIVHVLILQGRHSEAQKAMAQVPEGSQRDQGMALIYAATGREADSDEAVRRLPVESEHIMDTVRLAEVYAFRNMNAQAFEVLQGRKEAYQRAHGLNSPHAIYLQYESRLSPFLKTLHSDPRWSTFIAAPG